MSHHAESDSQPDALLDLREGGGVEQQRHPEAVVEHGGDAGGRLVSTVMTISRLGFGWGFVVGDVEEVGRGVRPAVGDG
jgi:hypothetical protein